MVPWFFAVGLFLLILGVVLFFILYISNGDSAFVTLGVVGGQGVIWLILSAIFGGIAGSGKKRIAEFKSYGKHYEAEITSLNPVQGVNVNMHTPVVTADCIYINDLQQRCKVRSRMFLWKGFSPEGLKADVYVDYNDPRKYAVEITAAGGDEPGVDVDYTR